MAFTVLTQMEESRQQKESILRRKGNNKPLIAGGILLLITALILIALMASVVLSPAPATEGTTSDNSFETAAFICAGIFGFTAIIFLLLGGLLTLSANHKIISAEKEYQTLRSQVIALVEGK